MAAGLTEPALAWELSPAVFLAAAGALAFFGRGFRRLRGRGRSDRAGWWRAAIFVAAVAVGTLAAVSPLHAAGEAYLLSAHMLQHVLIGDLVPALILLALRGPLFFHVVPVQAFRGTVGRVVERLLRPGVALAVWVATFVFWHLPPVYELAAGQEALHTLEHALFVTSGFLVWAQLVDPARRRRLTPQWSIAFACVVFVAGQVLVNTLIINPNPVYGFYAQEPVRLFGLSPAEDQQAAALTMMVEQLLTVGTFVALRVRVLLRMPPGLTPERHPFAV